MSVLKLQDYAFIAQNKRFSLCVVFSIKIVDFFSEFLLKTFVAGSLWKRLIMNMPYLPNTSVIR